MGARAAAESRISRIERVVAAAVAKGSLIPVGGRKLTRQQQEFAQSIFGLIAQHSGRLELLLQREEVLQNLGTLARKAAAARENDEPSRRRWLNDTLHQLRDAVPAWGTISVSGGRVKMAFSRTDDQGYGEDVASIVELELRRDDGSWESVVNPRAKKPRVIGEVLGDELSHPVQDVIARAESREALLAKMSKWWGQLHPLQMILVVGLALGLVGCGIWLAPRIVRWIKSLSSIQHAPPAPPLHLDGGVTIESAKRPSTEPTTLLPNDPGDASDFVLIWDSHTGDVVVAESMERVRYLRVAPDSEILWTWTVTIDGSPHQYETTADAIHITGVAGKRLGFGVRFSDALRRSLTYSIGDDRRLQADKDHVARTPTDFTDGAMTIGQGRGSDVDVKWASQVVLGRASWRPPLVRYSCDEKMACTFTLAPGPWHPCWQKVEVDFGDGTVVDTRGAPTGVLANIKGPLLSGDWDAQMLRAEHRYTRAAAYPFAFGLRRAESSTFAGPCEPGPPREQADRLRWFEARIEVAPLTQGQAPPSPDGSQGTSRP